MLHDRDSKQICIGDEVLMPSPTNDDLWNHEFVGTVTGFRHGNVQVTDQEDDVWEIEPERVKVISNTAA